MSNLQTKGFQNVMKVDDALRTLLQALNSSKPRTESISVARALGRVLSEDIVSKKFLPPVDRSVVDGYAVRSSDVASATVAQPSTLNVVGESRIGEVPRVEVMPGQTVAVATGSVVPRGADAVVMIENTRTPEVGRISVHVPILPGKGISKKGEDVAPGALVLSKGHRLRSQDLGLLRALGITKLRVAKPPRIGIISTGNELTNLARRGDAAKTVDVNRTVLSAMSLELGAQPVDFGIARDSECEILSLMRKAVRSCDIVITTAGSSVGKKDLVPKCINKLGKPGMLVHGIAMRPSLPTGLAVVDGKPILSLPGVPVSAMIAFRVFARPLVARLMGNGVPADPVVKAVLKQSISGQEGHRTFVRVRLRRTQQGLVAEPLPIQRSSVLMSMVAANGIVVIPEDLAGFEAGREVDVTVMGDIET